MVITHHAATGSGVTEKIFAANGKVITLICKKAQSTKENNNFGLVKNPISARGRSLRIWKECTNWERLNTAKVMVEPDPK